MVLSVTETKTFSSVFPSGQIFQSTRFRGVSNEQGLRGTNRLIRRKG